MVSFLTHSRWLSRVNESGDCGETALIKAAKQNHHDVIKVLLGVPHIAVNQADVFGNNALSLAACNGHKQSVTELLSAFGIDVNHAN